jgi:protein arginine N-methyltransferase 1
MTRFLPLGGGYADLMAHHRQLLDDRVRTEAFRRAIARAVRPGDAVAELGAGTGVLSIAARRAGARVVYAIERQPIVRVAAQVARDNGVDGIVWLEREARDVTLPEPIDVLVSECFGPLAVGGTMLAALVRLRERVLRPGGAVVPSSVTPWIAPVEAPRDWAYTSVWTRPRYGLDWDAAAALASCNVYNTTFAPGALVGRAPLGTIDLSRGDFDGAFSSTVELRAARSARVHGLCGWFEAELAPGVRLSTAPGRASTVWRQLFFPLQRPVRVRRGAPIRIVFACARAEPPAVVHFDWSGELDGVPFRQSTRYSFPA